MDVRSVDHWIPQLILKRFYDNYVIYGTNIKLNDKNFGVDWAKEIAPVPTIVDKSFRDNRESKIGKILVKLLTTNNPSSLDKKEQNRLFDLFDLVLIRNPNPVQAILHEARSKRIPFNALNVRSDIMAGLSAAGNHKLRRKRWHAWCLVNSESPIPLPECGYHIYSPNKHYFEVLIPIEPRTGLVLVFDDGSNKMPRILENSFLDKTSINMFIEQQIRVRQLYGSRFALPINYEVING